jgi:hypothetical protein
MCEGRAFIPRREIMRIRILLAIVTSTFHSSIFANTCPEFEVQLTPNGISLVSETTTMTSLPDSEVLDQKLAAVLKMSGPFKRFSVAGQEITARFPDGDTVANVIFIVKPALRILPDMLITLSRTRTKNAVTYQLRNPIRFYEKYDNVFRKNLNLDRIRFSLVISPRDIRSQFQVEAPHFEEWLNTTFSSLRWVGLNQPGHKHLTLSEAIYGVFGYLRSVHTHLRTL